MTECILPVGSGKMRTLKATLKNCYFATSLNFKYYPENIDLMPVVKFFVGLELKRFAHFFKDP